MDNKYCANYMKLNRLLIACIANSTNDKNTYNTKNFWNGKTKSLATKNQLREVEFYNKADESQNRSPYYSRLELRSVRMNGDIEHEFLEVGNKQYHPGLCLIVPHSINTFYENIEVGKTSITYSKKTKKYSVKVSDGNKNIGANNIDTYNEALDAFCDIKQGILVRMTKSLQDQIPDKVYQAMMNTDVKSINAKHYEILE